MPVTPVGINGFCAATFSPFKVDGELNVDVIAAQARWLHDTGVSSVFVNGTTGESLKMTTAERLTQAQAWVAAVEGLDISVIVHVGAESIKDSIELAKHAQKIGAAGVGAMPPVFFKPGSPEALALHLASIAAACPNLPFYYYHIPSMTGVNFSMKSVVAAISSLEGSFLNFAGIKYTGLYNTPGFMDIVNLSEDQPHLELLGGRDEMLPQMLAAGLKGFVGSQYNIIADLYSEVRKRFEAHDILGARKMQKLTIDFIERCCAAGSGGFKAALNFAVPVGDARLPALPFSPDARAALKKSLAEWCDLVVAAGGPKVKLTEYVQ